ncbi:unnamed protein product [Larinioides sclopetarius]|uniref:Uncharacterized protein n=1 Tax=Larinioides sclopetarius TaxID=280406 RepID=A0AAV1ZEJ8_9ARAC
MTQNAADRCRRLGLLTPGEAPPIQYRSLSAPKARDSLSGFNFGECWALNSYCTIDNSDQDLPEAQYVNEAYSCDMISLNTLSPERTRRRDQSRSEVEEHDGCGGSRANASHPILLQLENSLACRLQGDESQYVESSVRIKAKVGCFKVQSLTSESSLHADIQRAWVLLHFRTRGPPLNPSGERAIAKQDQNNGRNSLNHSILKKLQLQYRTRNEESKWNKEEKKKVRDKKKEREKGSIPPKEQKNDMRSNPGI